MVGCLVARSLVTEEDEGAEGAEGLRWLRGLIGLMWLLYKTVIWSEHHGNRLYGFIWLASKMSEWTG